MNLKECMNIPLKPCTSELQQFLFMYGFVCLFLDRVLLYIAWKRAACLFVYLFYVRYLNCMFLSVPQACLVSMEARRILSVSEFPETASHELPCGCWERKLGSLQEQQEHWLTELSLWATMLPGIKKPSHPQTRSLYFRSLTQSCNHPVCPRLFVSYESWPSLPEFMTLWVCLLVRENCKCAPLHSVRYRSCLLSLFENCKSHMHLYYWSNSRIQ